MPFMLLDTCFFCQEIMDVFIQDQVHEKCQHGRNWTCLPLQHLAGNGLEYITEACALQGSHMLHKTRRMFPSQMLIILMSQLETGCVVVKLWEDSYHTYQKIPDLKHDCCQSISSTS